MKGKKRKATKVPDFMETTGEDEDTNDDEDSNDDEDVVTIPRLTCGICMNPLIGKDYSECYQGCGEIGHQLCFDMEGCPNGCE